jgi:hypothetical protein
MVSERNEYGMVRNAVFGLGEKKRKGALFWGRAAECCSSVLLVKWQRRGNPFGTHGSRKRVRNGMRYGNVPYYRHIIVYSNVRGCFGVHMGVPTAQRSINVAFWNDHSNRLHTQLAACITNDKRETGFLN